VTNSCTFCKIANNEIQAAVVYRDEKVTAFRDIRPVAPAHILIVPNKHIESINEMDSEDQLLVGHMIYTARQIAAQEGFHKDGYRLVINTGPDGGQTVFHLHVHLIGQRQMRWPPG
jgi:histidine triad (HIT) family protein